MKLIKIHLLNHFVDCICLYGSAVNFNGAVGESHLKSKTKQPARCTKMCIIDMEYQTALKDYEQIVLEYGNREMMKANTVERNDVNVRNRYGHRYVLVEKDGLTIIKEITKKKIRSSDRTLGRILAGHRLDRLCDKFEFGSHFITHRSKCPWL